VVDMADAGAAQLLTLPAIRKLVVRQVRVHGAENVKEMRFRVNRRRG
jgi:hypothetical protein